jgi:hypothetical protein
MNISAAIEGAAVTLPPGIVPRWEQRFPGRFRYELNQLRSRGVTPEVDVAALEAGRLEMSFDWRLDGQTTIRLRAVYPDAFPHTRPQVFLLSGLDNPPVRHLSPVEKNICLLGRDTRQWLPKWSLAKLLSEQLEDALRGTGEEDPQGEPADVWWNMQGVPGAFCLIDSQWALDEVNSGTLLLRYDAQIGMCGAHRLPIIRAVVTEVRDSNTNVIATWDGPMPPEIAVSTSSVTIPWVRLPEIILPSPELCDRVRDLRAAHQPLQRLQPHKVTSMMSADLFAIAHPVEVAHGETGIGWVLFQTSGKPNAFYRGKGKPKAPPVITTIPVFRAGPTDLGHRVPAVTLLRSKRIVIVGIGAIGAPVAIELARNGCGVLHLLEHDIIEPGNTVRWPLGASAWGQSKLAALKSFLAREYPGTAVHDRRHFVGQIAEGDAAGDDEVFSALLPEVDLVIDASASHGVTTLLADRCCEYGVPLISLFATPTVEGGAVVRHVSRSGCPNCLLHAWDKGEITPPPGNGDDTGLSQPPGCAERTFVGAGYDLQELSLQTVRFVVETLSESDGLSSVVQTLSFTGEDGKRIPPVWRVDDLPAHPACSCQPDE